MTQAAKSQRVILKQQGKAPPVRGTQSGTVKRARRTDAIVPDHVKIADALVRAPAKSPPRMKKSVGHTKPGRKVAKPQPASGRAARPDSKLAILEALLRRAKGMSIADACAALGWQAHSVRGAMAGSLKKKGLAIVSEKVDGVRVYRIGDAGNP